MDQRRSVFTLTLVLLILYGPSLAIARPSSLDQNDLNQMAYQRSLATDAATYLLVPVAIVVGTEGAILGATGVTFGDGIQSVGEGIKLVGDEIKDAGDGFTNLSRGLKGLSSVIYQWGTGGSKIPVLGKDSDLTDSLEVLSKLSPDLSRQVLDFYFHSLSSSDSDDSEDQSSQSDSNDSMDAPFT